jgi:uncharacterized protein YlxP (DUF503 family)
LKFFVGIARLRLDCSMCSSLKDKRRIVKSLLDRLGNSRLTGAAEVGDLDYWKSSVIGVVAISSSRKLVSGALDGAMRMIESSGVEVIDREQWIVKPEDL